MTNGTSWKKTRQQSHSHTVTSEWHVGKTVTALPSYETSSQSQFLL